MEVVSECTVYNAFFIRFIIVHCSHLPETHFIYDVYNLKENSESKDQS